MKPEGGTFWEEVKEDAPGTVVYVVAVHDQSVTSNPFAEVRPLDSQETTRLPLDERWGKGLRQIFACPEERCGQPLPGPHTGYCRYSMMHSGLPMMTDQPEREEQCSMTDVVAQVKVEDELGVVFWRCPECHAQVLAMWDSPNMEKVRYQQFCPHDFEQPEIVVVKDPVGTGERLEALMLEGERLVAAMEHGSFSDDAMRTEIARARVHLSDTEWGELGG